MLGCPGNGFYRETQGRFCDVGLMHVQSCIIESNVVVAHREQFVIALLTSDFHLPWNQCLNKIYKQHVNT